LSQDANVIVSDGAPEIRHQNYIMSDRPIGGDSISTEVRDPPSKVGLPSISSGSVNCLREVENCRGKLQICGTECETIRTAAATDIEQPSSAAEVHMFGHEARWTKRAGMLRRAKTFSADSGVINETLVEALVREHPLATKGSAKMPETLIAKKRRSPD
jgi:hypothetical protein